MIRSEAQTEQLGSRLARCVPTGTTVCLVGTLGAGKTRLVQAIATACQVPRDRVVSPTFTLCNEYSGSIGIVHLDLYRVADEDELFELGIEEYFESPDLKLIEWADRFEANMPDERLEISLEVTGDTSRRVQLRATSDQLTSVLNEVTSGWPPDGCNDSAES